MAWNDNHIQPEPVWEGSMYRLQFEPTHRGDGRGLKLLLPKFRLSKTVARAFVTTGGAVPDLVTARNIIDRFHRPI